MSGISSKAVGKLENRKQYNGIEHTTDLGLNHYDAFYRNLDPQIGRFMQIDPEMDNQESSSPYESMGNNPISNIDPLGDFKTRFGAWWHSLWHGGKVGKNSEGEYFVSKPIETKSSEDGSVTVGVSVTYGKGRHAMSAAGERMQAENYKQAYEDRMINLEVWQRHETVAQANEATFKNSVGVLLPNILKGSIGVIKTTKPIAKSQNIISRTINSGQQGKHIVGHNNYQSGRSILSESAQELLDAFNSGNINSSQTINTVKIRVDFGKVIGNYKNPETGQLVPTTKGIIHNGKNGAHIVPSSPN
jgi:RHS repeat-associated protein